jgi:hypothetical protein
MSMESRPGSTEDAAAARQFYRALLNWQEPVAADFDVMPDVNLLRGRRDQREDPRASSWLA